MLLQEIASPVVAPIPPGSVKDVTEQCNPQYQDINVDFMSTDEPTLDNSLLSNNSVVSICSEANDTNNSVVAIHPTAKSPVRQGTDLNERMFFYFT